MFDRWGEKLTEERLDAGPARQAKQYQESVYQGFAEENDAAGETWTSIEVSQCTYTDAAENVALSEYFYQPGHRPNS